MNQQLLKDSDFERVNVLLERFNKSTGFVTVILDLEDNTLSQPGWRTIYLDFHRQNPETASSYFVSDTFILHGINTDSKFQLYKCVNGLIDVRLPIVVKGEHVANLYSGQFLFEEPDISFFRNEALKYGFDVNSYLESVRKVPVVSKEKILILMDFLLDITKLIVEMTVEKIEQAEIVETIKRSQETHSENQLQLKQILKDLLESQRIAHLGTWRLDLVTNEVVWSEEMYRMYGFDPTIPPPVYTEHMKLFTSESWNRLSTSLDVTRTTGVPYELELETVTKDGSNGWMWVRGEAEKDSQGKIISLWGAAQDITQYKRTELEVRQSEERFQLLFNNAPLGYQSLDSEGHFIEVNQQWLDMLGYSREEVIGKWFGEFLIPEYVKGFRKRFPIFKKQGYIHSEFEMLSKEGKVLSISFDGKIGYSSDGEFKQTHCILHDISDQRNAEKALVDSEERFRYLFEHSGVGIGYYSIDGVIISYNKKMLEYYGEELQGYVGQSIRDVSSKEDADKFFARLRSIKSDEQSIQYEDSLYLNNKLKWFSNTLSKVKNSNGEVIGVQIVSVDITDRKQVEDKILNQNSLFESLLRLLPVGVFMVDATEGKPLIVNDMGVKLLGSGILPDTNEQNLSEVYKAFKADTNKPYPTSEMPIVMGMKGIASHIDDMVVERTDGTKVLLEVFGTSVYDKENTPWASLVTFMDITERKKTERGLANLMMQNQRILDHLQDTYFQADLAGQIITVNPQIEKMYGYSPQEIPGQLAEILYADPVDRDILIEELSKRGFLADYVIQGRRKDSSTFWVSMNVQYIKDEKGKILGTEALIRDITERIIMQEEIELQRDNLIATNSKLSHLFQQSVQSISKIGELRDVYTAGHQRHVTELACAIAKQLGLSEEAITNLSYGSQIHDIGKIYVPAEILNKPGKLSNLEFEMIQTHVEHGYNIVKEIDFPEVIPTMIYQHHERLDGSGYPNGITGDQIIIESRILAVSDVVEAMTAHRPYRPALGIDAALEEILKFKGKKYDSEVVDVCVRLFREEGFKFSNSI